ncbi:hypothetical protein AGABI2DRAFT_191936 [Agaricus bisporus var. bisporus H97]|uniref:hypothetical protein n=1 Tax=Agaricus bisporus var. bisporus (strain H97 / ATCC MYA-4626 / FGSC 10389) TaxID=936046 RepID=UPI00029F5E54|nr:hypothetical protein AGABI2DRAFT_191936 [Agaricus bisporus var. bisporus H97]EKV48314.1 hypothetical protein AGABI2DRAFT_191936 [Agaricus bisporus var. bisporus H97]
MIALEIYIVIFLDTLRLVYVYLPWRVYSFIITRRTRRFGGYSCNACQLSGEYSSSSV